jgi:hypothetical protein
MRLQKSLILPALLTASFLGSCAASTPLVDRPNLPVAPSNFGKPVALPVARPGGSIKKFALENRAAAIEANNRLVNDGAFYDSVLKSFSK